jgi:tRNA modification GTPase
MISTQNQMHNTITALATASGVASISIIRVSGDGALDIAKAITNKTNFTPRYAHLCNIYNKTQDLIDQAIVIYFKAPFSFTGEDIVEFQCHGGLVVAQEILDSVLQCGARLANPGEFSKRAFLNGKIDLSEAEAISKLIEAKSVDAAKILARQLKGELKEFVDTTRDALLKAMAYSEVMIDYAEEDIPAETIDAISNQLDNLIVQIDNIVEASLRRKGLIEGFKVAIVGKPNVGKSSLLNALLAYDRAIVSDIAGTTRDTIEEQIRIGSHIIRLVDTAGIRESNDTIEKIGIEKSMQSIEQSDIVIALFDASREFDSEDENILEMLQKNQDKHIIVALNKTDLPKIIDITKLKNYSYIEVSAKRGFKSLTTKLQEILDSITQTDELMLVSTRQIEAVVKAKNALLEAKEPLLNEELEFFSYHIQDAITAISSISKPYNNEEILDKMFGEFCLGK